jgi:hypothetical protein
VIVEPEILELLGGYEGATDEHPLPESFEEVIELLFKHTRPQNPLCDEGK